MSEKLKSCPIPGCGAEANARSFEPLICCSNQACEMRKHGITRSAWQALPRASNSVLEIAAEMQGVIDFAINGDVVGVYPDNDQFAAWVTRLKESTAPVVPKVDTGNCSTCSQYLSSYADGSCRIGNNTKASMCCFHSEYKARR